MPLCSECCSLREREIGALARCPCPCFLSAGVVSLPGMQLCGWIFAVAVSLCLEVVFLLIVSQVE